MDIFQRLTDELVISIERGPTGHVHAVSVPPQNIRQDKQVIPKYGDDGYLYTGEPEHSVFEEAENWVQEPN